MKKHPILGWPIVSEKNCFDVVRNLGITPWNKVSEDVPAGEFLNSASSAQRDDYERFAPKPFVASYENPSDRSVFTGFKIKSTPYVSVFVVIDGLVAVTAEWKHGNEKITLVPVSGVPGKEESGLVTVQEKMAHAALREWREETGTLLSSITPLSSGEGIFSNVRNTTSQYFPFLGRLQNPIHIVGTELDEHEQLSVLLFPVNDWINLLEKPCPWEKNPDFGLETCARDITYRALRELGMLKLS